MLLSRAELLLDAGRPQEALSALGPWIAAHPHSALPIAQAALCHRALRQRDAELTAAHRAVALAPNERFVQLVLAGSLIGSGRHMEADRIVQRLIGRHPEDVDAHRIATQASLPLGAAGRRRALRHARRVTELAPLDPTSFALLARVLGLQGRLLASRRAATQARRLGPTDTGVRRSLAAVDLESFQPGAAAEGFSAVLADRPTDVSSVRLLASALIRAAMLSALVIFALLIVGGGVALVVSSHQAGYDPDAPADLAGAAPLGIRLACTAALLATAAFWWRGISGRRHLLGRWARQTSRSVVGLLTYLLLIITALAVLALIAGAPTGLYPAAIGGSLVTMLVGAVGRAKVGTARRL